MKSRRRDIGRRQGKEYVGYVGGKRKHGNTYGKDVGDGKSWEQEAVEWVLGEEGEEEKWMRKMEREADEKRKGRKEEGEEGVETGVGVEIERIHKEM